jgi:hypothetical protein
MENPTGQIHTSPMESDFWDIHITRAVRPLKSGHKPVTVSDRTTYGTLSPKCETSLENGQSGTHILSDCEAIAYLRFHHLGHYFVQPGDYHAPL